MVARADLAAAKAADAEWMVLEPRVDPLPVTLTTILARAEAAQASGDVFLATDLADKVSRFARLGLEQAAAQEGAAPYYPQ